MCTSYWPSLPSRWAEEPQLRHPPRNHHRRHLHLHHLQPALRAGGLHLWPVSTSRTHTLPGTSKKKKVTFGCVLVCDVVLLHQIKHISLTSCYLKCADSFCYRCRVDYSRVLCSRVPLWCEQPNARDISSRVKWETPLCVRLLCCRQVLFSGFHVVCHVTQWLHLIWVSLYQIQWPIVIELRLRCFFCFLSGFYCCFFDLVNIVMGGGGKGPAANHPYLHTVSHTQ